MLPNLYQFSWFWASELRMELPVGTGRLCASTAGRRARARAAMASLTKRQMRTGVALVSDLPMEPQALECDGSSCCGAYMGRRLGFLAEPE